MYGAARGTVTAHFYVAASQNQNASLTIEYSQFLQPI
jgi:hypothetical protein